MHNIVKGLYVFATARTPAVIADLAGPNISVLQLDVTDSASISNCQSEVDRIASGRLDILINNA
jgi:1-acylglycerone phosphate reductase